MTIKDSMCKGYGNTLQKAIKVYGDGFLENDMWRWQIVWRRE